MNDERFVDRQRHGCGCDTVWDCDEWTSVTLQQCAMHQQVVQELRSGWPESGEGTDAG